MTVFDYINLHPWWTLVFLIVLSQFRIVEVVKYFSEKKTEKKGEK